MTTESFALPAAGRLLAPKSLVALHTLARTIPGTTVTVETCGGFTVTFPTSERDQVLDFLHEGDFQPQASHMTEPAEFVTCFSPDEKEQFFIGWYDRPDGRVVLGGGFQKRRIPIAVLGILAASGHPVMVSPRATILVVDLTEAEAEVLAKFLAPAGMVFDVDGYSPL